MAENEFPRRNLLRYAVGAATSSALAQRGSRPNILYIHSHDTGRYLQPYGHAVPAPNLQRLAEGGVLFRKAFNAAPVIVHCESAMRQTEHAVAVRTHPGQQTGAARRAGGSTWRTRCVRRVIGQC